MGKSKMQSAKLALHLTTPLAWDGCPDMNRESSFDYAVLAHPSAQDVILSSRVFVTGLIWVFFSTTSWAESPCLGDTVGGRSNTAAPLRTWLP